MNIETAYEIFRTMDEAMKASAVPDKHNKEYFEAVLLLEG